MSKIKLNRFIQLPQQNNVDLSTINELSSSIMSELSDSSLPLLPPPPSKTTTKSSSGKTLPDLKSTNKQLLAFYQSLRGYQLYLFIIIVIIIIVSFVLLMCPSLRKMLTTGWAKISKNIFKGKKDVQVAAIPPTVMTSTPVAMKPIDEDFTPSLIISQENKTASKQIQPESSLLKTKDTETLPPVASPTVLDSVLTETSAVVASVHETSAVVASVQETSSVVASDQETSAVVVSSPIVEEVTEKDSTAISSSTIEEKDEDDEDDEDDEEEEEYEEEEEDEE